MPNQIIDIVEMAMPGPMGDVTSEAIAAADRARDEADRAEDARDQAETFSATTVALQDAAVAALAATPGSETQTQLDATYGTFIRLADRATGADVTDVLEDTLLECIASGKTLDITGNWTYSGPGIALPEAYLSIRGSVNGGARSRITITSGDCCTHFGGYVCFFHNHIMHALNIMRKSSCDKVSPYRP